MDIGENKVLKYGANAKNKRKLEFTDYAIIATCYFGSLMLGITAFHCPPARKIRSLRQYFVLASLL
ncbi:MAG: hypothetical protein LBK58_07415 [Prevotellaceae bacterium]|jgi:hypothetical protein|nr:hypothetical protein [Prevotellaceae bacterium]